MSDTVAWLPWLAATFSLSLTLTFLAARCARRLGLLDVPGHRSAHRQATPLGGGVALVIAFSFGVAVVHGMWGVPAGLLLALGGGVVVATTGLADDIWHLPAGWRIFVHFLAAVWAVAVLGLPTAVSFGSWELESRWLLAALAVPAMVWLVNLCNFMDGIDGLAGSQLVYTATACAALAGLAGDAATAVIGAMLAAAGAGFLWWNWPPARIFLGDAGSSFIGYAIGILALATVATGSLSVWTWLLLLGVFAADATVTLGRRLCRGHRWNEGHASHAYQHLARKFSSHAKVTQIALIINVVWLAPLAWLSERHGGYGFSLFIVGIAPLLAGAWVLGAGVPPACRRTT